MYEKPNKVAGVSDSINCDVVNGLIVCLLFVLCSLYRHIETCKENYIKQGLKFLYIKKCRQTPDDTTHSSNFSIFKKNKGMRVWEL